MPQGAQPLRGETRTRSCRVEHTCSLITILLLSLSLYSQLLISTEVAFPRPFRTPRKER